MRFDLAPTIPRVLIIAILLFAEAFLVPVLTTLQLNRMPTDIEWFTYLVTAAIQLITFLMAFVKGEEVKE